jgi:aspartyl-tRNA(Asn)/glutamyl-tRNA(Gln) amidotransferase subunit A
LYGQFPGRQQLLSSSRTSSLERAYKKALCSIESTPPEVFAMHSRRYFMSVLGSLPLLLQARRLLAQSNIDVTALGIAEASALLRNGDLSPSELTQAYLQRIERHEGTLNVYVTVTAERALQQAQTATAELMRGEWRGPLHGIPLALKDNIDTAGIATTAANAMLANRIPDEDAPVWIRLREAGAILLGKLNMHEFAYGGTSSISHVGPVRNPWNIERIPGGSSGGSAAAVAAQLCCVALGTDTLASIRLPASYCGVAGLKPTHGLSSIRGIIPVSESLDHVGPLGRSIADCAEVLRVIAGFDPRDPVSIEAPPTDYAATLQNPARGLRIGIPRSPYYERLQPDIDAAMVEALRVLEQLTGSIRDVTLPDAGDFVPLLAESYAWHEPYLQDQANHRHYHASTLERIVAAAQTPVEVYIRALQQMQVARNQVAAVFNDVDVLVTPTNPGLPEAISGAQLAEANSAEASVRNTAPFNLYGIPTISLPCGFSASGLPIGMQLSSARLNEAALFALGAAWQQASDWHLRRPALA